MKTDPGLPSGESSTDLASTRTMLAAERTLMAWIRTALSMISFGFTISKFLHALNDARGIRLRRPEEPRNLGIFLTALGIGSLVAGIFEYLGALRRTEGRRVHLGSAFYVAFAVVGLGLWVFVGLVRRHG